MRRINPLTFGVLQAISSGFSVSLIFFIFVPRLMVVEVPFTLRSFVSITASPVSRVFPLQSVVIRSVFANIVN